MMMDFRLPPGGVAAGATVMGLAMITGAFFSVAPVPPPASSGYAWIAALAGLGLIGLGVFIAPPSERLHSGAL